MPIIEKSFEQRSENWFKARAGNIGASNFNKIITMDGKPSKSRKDCLYQMASEVVRGRADDTFQSAAMLNGQIQEDNARSLFEFLHDTKVEQVAMVYKDDKKQFHASPDGLLGLDEGIEIKCPLGKTQAKYLYDNKVPSEHFVQIQGSLYVCERKVWWFMSYVADMRPLIIKVKRDEIFIGKLKAALEIFCSELKELVRKIK